MVDHATPPAYHDRSRALRAVGFVLLLLGAAFALLGPLETYCFYLFSPGGRFAYDGFAFGSFMFGNIASQIAGYYVISVVLLVLGYGHLRRRRWSRIVVLALLGCWPCWGAGWC